MLELVIILLCTNIVAGVFLAIYYAESQSNRKFVKALYKEKFRLTRERNLWQNAYVKAKGGELKPKPPREPSETKPKRIVSASEVVSELQQKKVPEILTERVPKAIEKEFLAEAKKFT